MRDDPVLLGFTVTVFLITVCVRGRVQEYAGKVLENWKGSFQGLKSTGKIVLPLFVLWALEISKAACTDFCSSLKKYVAWCHQKNRERKKVLPHRLQSLQRSRRFSQSPCVSYFPLSARAHSHISRVLQIWLESADELAEKDKKQHNLLAKSNARGSVRPTYDPYMPVSPVKHCLVPEEIQGAGTVYR